MKVIRSKYLGKDVTVIHLSPSWLEKLIGIRNKKITLRYVGGWDGSYLWVKSKVNNYDNYEVLSIIKY